MFSKLLIANRGEIACRIARTARRMGIGTVAVFSDADAHAAHVAACDEAVHIGGARPQESYLRGDVILEAARRTGAAAIHPGYGFLSENADFARACGAAGVVFVGPSPEAIAAMGSKSAAKALMEKAGVPLTPGYHGQRQEAEFLLEEARRIGFPVLIKAVAGGGGKGMRRVDRAGGFRRGARGLPARGAVELRRRSRAGREVREPGPAHRSPGLRRHAWQRRLSIRAGLLGAAPSPEGHRGGAGARHDGRNAGAQMGEAAVAAARAVNYSGAGTVEFIAAPDGAFYFMEMNTRLQVEHPVTEMITGLDLVEWQLRVAAGEPLPLRQDELAIHGHAIEARIYAEDPAREFLPSIGTLEYLSTPATSREVRIDTGVRQGDEITPYYDPMIAKLIVHGADRAEAVARLRAALGEYHVVGVQTNIEFLHRLTSAAVVCRAAARHGAHRARTRSGCLRRAARRRVSPGTSPCWPSFCRSAGRRHGSSPWDDTQQLDGRRCHGSAASQGEVRRPGRRCKADVPGVHAYGSTSAAKSTSSVAISRPMACSKPT